MEVGQNFRYDGKRYTVLRFNYLVCHVKCHDNNITYGLATSTIQEWINQSEDE